LSCEGELRGSNLTPDFLLKAISFDLVGLVTSQISVRPNEERCLQL